MFAICITTFWGPGTTTFWGPGTWAAVEWHGSTEKQRKPLWQGTGLCLWSCHNLLGMARFFSFQSEGILVSLDNESKEPNKPVCELSGN